MGEEKALVAENSPHEDSCRHVGSYAEMAAAPARQDAKPSPLRNIAACAMRYSDEVSVVKTVTIVTAVNSSDISQPPAVTVALEGVGRMEVLQASFLQAPCLWAVDPWDRLRLSLRVYPLSLPLGGRKRSMMPAEERRSVSEPVPAMNGTGPFASRRNP